MLIEFNEEQKAILRGLGINPLQEFTVDNVAETGELVTQHLQMHGINPQGELNAVGKTCESIMWALAQA